MSKIAKEVFIEIFEAYTKQKERENEITKNLIPLYGIVELQDYTYFNLIKEILYSMFDYYDIGIYLEHGFGVKKMSINYHNGKLYNSVEELYDGVKDNESTNIDKGHFVDWLNRYADIIKKYRNLSNSIVTSSWGGNIENKLEPWVMYLMGTLFDTEMIEDWVWELDLGELPLKLVEKGDLEDDLHWSISYDVSTPTKLYDYCFNDIKEEIGRKKIKVDTETGWISAIE